MPPPLVAVIGSAMCALGLYGIQDFRHWNGRRTDPVGLRSFLAIVLAVLAFLSLVLVGGLLVPVGLQRFAGG